MRAFRIQLALTLALALAGPARTAETPPTAGATTTHELQLIYVTEANTTRYIFVMGQSGFTSVESLKAYLGTLPKGTEIRWAPGCERLGGEPLLSSESDMKSFRTFLEKKGLKFTLIPSG